jgi:hypothetical protein
MGATDKHATTEELLKAMFTVWYMLMLYEEEQF